MTTMTTMTTMNTIIAKTTVEGRGDCRTANSLRINHYKVLNVSVENMDLLQFQESIKRSMCGEWRRDSDIQSSNDFRITFQIGRYFEKIFT